MHDKHTTEQALEDPEHNTPVVPTADAPEVEEVFAPSKGKAATKKPKVAKKALTVVAKPTVEPTRKSGRKTAATIAMQESNAVVKPTRTVGKKAAAPSTPMRNARSSPLNAEADDELGDDSTEEVADGEEVEIAVLKPMGASRTDKVYPLRQGTHIVGDYALPLLAQFEHLIPDSGLLGFELEQRRKLKVEQAKKAAADAGVPYEPPPKAPKRKVYKWWEHFG
jgi:hypothetical protein